MRANTISVEAVLADGTIIKGSSHHRKDNTGYSLGHLLVGSEGTLAVITGAALLTAPMPASTHLALLLLEDYEGVGEVLRMAKAMLGEILSAFEFWDGPAHGLLEKHGMAERNLFRANISNPFYLLIETRGGDVGHDRAKIERFMDRSITNDCILDGILAMDESQTARLWAMRESIPEACAREGKVLKYDVSLPPGRMYELVRMAQERLIGTKTTVIGYGHVGDGNLHLNVAVSESMKTVVKGLLEPFIYEQVSRMAGSISAEHGIGQLKRPYLSLSKPPPMIELMRRVKGLFDPQGILNPHKVFC